MMGYRRMMAAALLAIAAAGCTTPDQRAYNDAKVYIDGQMSQAKSGALPWATAYKSIYDYAMVDGHVRDPIQRQGLLTASAYLMPYARARDAGQITAEQFEDTRMRVQAEVLAWATQQQQSRAQLDAMRLQGALQGLSLIQQPQQPAGIAPVNCTTSRNGAFLNTTCR